MLQVALKEWEAKKTEEAKVHEVRHLDQTYREQFYQKPIVKEELGKRVMKNINQNPIPQECRDTDFLADMGHKDRYASFFDPQAAAAHRRAAEDDSGTAGLPDR